MSDRAMAADWARRILEDGTALILDTETTGLDTTDEIVQLALIDLSGAVLLDTLIKPSKPIPDRARQIHHISDTLVENAPTFDQVWPKLAALISGRTVIIYNAAYDLQKLTASRACSGGAYLADVRAWWDRYTAAEPETRAIRVECAMEMYSTWVSDWSEWHGNYRWQKLPGGDHTALGDARATLAVLKRMAGTAEMTSNPDDVSTPESEF